MTKGFFKMEILIIMMLLFPLIMFKKNIMVRLWKRNKALRRINIEMRRKVLEAYRNGFNAGGKNACKHIKTHIVKAERNIKYNVENSIKSKSGFIAYKDYFIYSEFKPENRTEMLVVAESVDVSNGVEL